MSRPAEIEYDKIEYMRPCDLSKPYCDHLWHFVPPIMVKLQVSSVLFTAQTDKLILMLHSLIDMIWREDMYFWGHNDKKLHLGSLTPRIPTWQEYKFQLKRLPMCIGDETWDEYQLWALIF